MQAIYYFIFCVVSSLSLCIAGVTYSIIPNDMTFYTMMQSLHWNFSTLLKLDSLALQFYILMFTDCVLDFFLK